MSGDAALPVPMRPSSTEDASGSVPVPIPIPTPTPTPTPTPAPIPIPIPIPNDEPVQEEGEEKAQAQAQTLVRGRVQQPGLSSASAPSRVAVLQAPDNGLKPPAAGDAVNAGVLSTPTTPVPSIENYVASDQNVKKPRGPVPVPISASVSKRPNGHSILTQQLAEARGIALTVSGRSLDAPHPSPRLQQLPCDPLVGSRSSPDSTSQAIDPESQQNIREPNETNENDEDLLTPRASPRAIAMATSSAVSSMSLLSRTFDTSDFGDIEPRIKSHRDILRTVGRGMSTEPAERDRRPNESGLTLRTYSDSSMSPAAATPLTSNQAFSSQNNNGRPGAGSAAEPPSPARPRKPDHRVSMGPEKVWSIGSEDLSNAQDGQVEKSIAEVLAGVEHNARSRKASHSLRFFKEGLPEVKLKRQDSRPGPKDKASVTDDVLQKGGLRSEGPARSLQPSPGPSDEFPGRLTRTRTSPLPSTGTSPDEAEPVDYLKPRPDHKGHADPPSPSIEPDVQPAELPKHVDETASKKNAEEQEATSDTAVEDVVGEDGELSGEEKISSAVFVPHKGLHLQDGPEHSDGSESDVDAHVKPQQKSDDGSSWLVKADEPEADDPSTPGGHADDQEDVIPHHRREAEHSAIDPEPSSRGISMPSTSKELDPAPPKNSKPADLASPGYEEHVHDHQVGHEQPLDAIELVPYRHQVGGHTTVWRFSKKAVCKQLNNRENEFYEQIERHHRDLLPFLPRYIGVLNVTFSKQSRRKSTIKKDASAVSDRKRTEQKEMDPLETNGSVSEVVTPPKDDGRLEENSQPRMISQSLQSETQPVPTVTFLDNQHILPRSLLHPAAQSFSYMDRFRSSSVSVPASHYDSNGLSPPESRIRPSLEDRHANSWGTTVVNKKLRHEVFNDVFSPINVHRHKKAHQRTMQRRTLDRLLRPTSSDATLMRTESVPIQPSQPSEFDAGPAAPSQIPQKPHGDLSTSNLSVEPLDAVPSDVTGTSAPELDILSQSMSPQRKKRRHSGSALRRRPNDVSDDSRGNLRYWEEPDENYKGDQEDLGTPSQESDSLKTLPASGLNGTAEAKGTESSTAFSSNQSSAPSLATSPRGDLQMIPRPVNPKEAQVQRDSRVSYFLLLEDLTAGMKKPCIMDLKMGTRQYGVEATAKKQKSQQRKCAQTTSRELGVRVCGLQVWDAASQEYVFRDKYYGRSLKAGREFQEALTRFLYDGVDRSSILRHIPTVLLKLSKLEVIVRRLRGYRFYAASLLVTYDGDQSDQDNYDTAIEDSTTDFATDNEDTTPLRKRKNKREIDFKIADFANSVTPQDLAEDKSCPPQHPDEVDRGFLKGLRSLRRYFLKIQQDTRVELGLPSAQRNLIYDPQIDISEDEESVSE
ncbi:unnamed protein product [Discula destructiva]